MDGSNLNNNEAAGKNILSHDSKTWGMLSHLSTFSGFIVPFGNLIAPLIIFLSKKDQDEFITDQSKEALNFQITMSIIFIAGFILNLLYLIKTGDGGFPFVFILVLIGLGILWIFDLIITIVAAVKANDGVKFRYPLSIRFIR